jgi:hypothetical protein
LIVDELENVRSQDKERYQAIMTILNAGFQFDATVPRVERVKDGGHQTVYFNAYCPKALAGINKLADTIEDRSFGIIMARKKQSEHVERFNLRKQKKDLETLRKQMGAWAEARRGDVEAIYDDLDKFDELNATDDRFKDIAEPLVAIALLADSESANGCRRVWPDLKDVLLILGGRRDEVERNTAIGAMVEILKQILGDEESVFIASTDLVTRAQGTEGLGWLKSQKAMATFLNKLDLFARRDPTGNLRGYPITRDWVQDVENRYSVVLSGFEVSVRSVREPVWVRV